VTTIEIGSDAVCSDGFRGEVLAVVIDPEDRTVTHLVVEPQGRSGLARLAALGLADLTAGEIRLRCTEEQFKDLPAAEETLAEFVPGQPDPIQLLLPGWRDAGTGPAVEGSTIYPPIREKETVDLVPPGEVEERRGDRVHATDGDVGQVRAIRIDPGSAVITYLLLREGHLLSRKDVAIPADQIAGFDDGIRLRLTRQQVQDLPPADPDEPAR
jgi:sporulation protein YlmC with PRC-barrel domain